MINEKRIKNMSIEEMAKWLESICDCGACNQIEEMNATRTCDGNCKECLIKWLKSEGE